MNKLTNLKLKEFKEGLALNLLICRIELPTNPLGRERNQSLCSSLTKDQSCHPLTYLFVPSSSSCSNSRAIVVLIILLVKKKSLVYGFPNFASSYQI